MERTARHRRGQQSWTISATASARASTARFKRSGTKHPRSITKLCHRNERINLESEKKTRQENERTNTTKSLRLGCVWPFLFPCLVVLISTNVHQLACATSLRKLRRSVISRKLSVDRYSRTRERRRCAVGPAELSRRNAMRRRWGNMRCSPGSPRSVRAFRAIELRLSGTLRSLGSPAVATLQRTPIRRARAQRPRSPTGTAAPTEADPLFGPPTRKAEKPCRAMRPPTSVASAIHASV